jgi:hypothetical protein
MHDTGLAGLVPLGDGIVAFDDAASAAGAIAEIVGDYERHCAAARSFAEDWLDSDLVLATLLSSVGAT